MDEYKETPRGGGLGCITPVLWEKSTCTAAEVNSEHRPKQSQRSVVIETRLVLVGVVTYPYQAGLIYLGSSTFIDIVVKIHLFSPVP